MKIEKIERVCLNVENIDEAVKFFSDLFGITFDIRYDVIRGKKTIKVGDTVVEREKIATEYADRSFEEGDYRVAISPVMEMIQLIPPAGKEGLRSFAFKVSNIEEAKAEMKAKGVRLLAHIVFPHVKEAIFSPDDLHGARLILLEYDAPTAIDAVLQK